MNDSSRNLAERLDLGREVAGPPWILANRGLPLVAPENTLASFQRAMQAGADGLYYDLRSAADLEPVVVRDTTLERTAGVAARPEDLSMPELSGLDAGGWFSKDFVGEPVPFLDEVLEVLDARGRAPMHFIELHGAALIPELQRHLSALSEPRALRIASSRRDHCLELQGAGFSAVWLVTRAGPEELAFVRDAQLSGVAVTTPEGWETAHAQEDWPCERWIVGVESAQDLYRALQAGVNGVITSDVRRAQAVRALLAMQRDPGQGYPIRAGVLPVASHGLDGQAGDWRGEWRGEWRPQVTLCNPFSSSVRARAELVVGRGAFEVRGLPLQFELQAGEERSFEFELRGGSWSPGGDPALAVLFEWSAGPGRPAGRLLLDHTLQRMRTVHADGIAERVEMLRESPGAARASMTLQRRREFLAVAVENAGGLREVCAVAHIDGQTFHGNERLRVPLPPDFDSRPGGVPFACGFWGQEPQTARPVLRRWSGGLPAEPRSGDAGRLVPRPHA